MTQKPDNPPAFPHVADIVASSGNGDYTIRQITSGGMTLRDYFAAAALQGLGILYASTVAENGDAEPQPSKVTARVCYELADAMLKARESRHDD